MSDIIQPMQVMPAPKCPVCGGETVRAEVHKAMAKVLDVFRCTLCNVLYPKVKART